MRSEPRSARTPVWPLSLSLAATNQIDVSFSSSGYLDVSVHRVPSVTLCIHVTVTALNDRRVSPFRNPRITECLASPRGFSQLTTSFIAFRRQGIHPMLLSTCLLEKNFLPSLFNCKRAITFVMAGSYPGRTHNRLCFLSEVIRGAWRGGPGKT